MRILKIFLKFDRKLTKFAIKLFNFNKFWSNFIRSFKILVKRFKRLWLNLKQFGFFFHEFLFLSFLFPEHLPFNHFSVDSGVAVIEQVMVLPGQVLRVLYINKVGRHELFLFLIDPFLFCLRSFQLEGGLGSLVSIDDIRVNLLENVFPSFFLELDFPALDPLVVPLDHDVFIVFRSQHVH